VRRVAFAVVLLSLAATVSASPARAATGWQLEQPSPPPAPPGVTTVNRPLGLGKIGDIEFWSPNRGLLITGGNPPAVPAGVWSYNGAAWHLLSTVCGSGNGRIAWAGPDEFWTISDPAPNSEGAGQIATTLCHFQNGAVVASYATPTGSNDPYQTMTAAACNGPTDCWFAGKDAAPPLTGAFHLHWDGTTLSDVLGPQAHQVDGLAALNGQFFESALVSAGDQPQPPENPPVLLHRIVEGVTPDQEFADEPFTPNSNASVPSFLTLGTDGSELWAAGGATSTSSARPPFAARYVNGVFEQLTVDTTVFSAPNAFLGIAPEPGGSDAWVTVGQNQNDGLPLPAAEVARIAADGSTLEVDTLPAPGGATANKGSAAGPIVCPATGDCWMATKEGWLFHYSNGTSYSVDTDPNFFGVIDQRPPDAGTATFYPDSSPLDNSLANQVTVTVTPPTTPIPPRQTTRALVTQEHERLRGTTLMLSFKLTVRARVSLIGLRHGHRVASTGTHVLAPGRHTLSLPLDRNRWPTKLKLNVLPVKSKTGKAADTERGGSGAALPW
jgi:hypothetical protein